MAPNTSASRGLWITEIKTGEFVYVPEGRYFPSIGHSYKILKLRCAIVSVLFAKTISLDAFRPPPLPSPIGPYVIVRCAHCGIRFIPPRITRISVDDDCCVDSKAFHTSVAADYRHDDQARGSLHDDELSPTEKKIAFPLNRFRLGHSTF